MDVLVKNQGFDCVVKALRIGRAVRRSSWKEEEYVYYDPSNKKMYFSSLEPHPSIYYAEGQDVMAMDWEVFVF